MAPPMKPSREDMLATTFNAKLAKQGAKSRKLAEARDVNTMPDPKTYATVMGLLGERPDEMGFSVAHPKYKEIMQVAEPAFALGTAAQVVPLVKPAGQAVRGAAKALAPKAGQMVMDAAQATGMPVYGLGVVKPKGGNWLAETDDRIKRMAPYPDLSKSIAVSKARIASAENAGANPRSIEMMKADLQALERDQAVNNWTTRNLGNYIKKEMGTPDDPVRKLAEEGIVHAPHGDYIDVDSGTALAAKRSGLGFPAEGMGKSPEAKAWEELSDFAIKDTQAKNIQGADEGYRMYQAAKAKADDIYADINEKFDEMAKSTLPPGEAIQQMVRLPFKNKAKTLGREGEYEAAMQEATKIFQQSNAGKTEMLEANPWVSKLDPEERLYTGYFGDLGFDHIIDVLREDVRAGRIRPEQLSKVSMDQAVRRTYEYDIEMAKKMNQAATASMEGFPVHKEYPEGYKWIELAQPKMPDVIPEGWTMKEPKGGVMRAFRPDPVDPQFQTTVLGTDLPDLIKNIYKRHPDTPGNPNAALEQALKYEGDTMGHCVGGYCPDVVSGRSRIYSLRDPKGMPHVTIETNPMMNYERQAAEMKRAGATGEEIAAFFENPPHVIRQIKGKQNAAPVAAYLPYVQDFVRSGNWSDVGDLFNTGLRDIEKTPHLKKWLQEQGVEHPRYLTEKEYGAHEADFLLNKLKPEEGMKDGGEVKATPVKNKAAHGMSQALGAVHKFASEPFGYKNPPGEMISEILGVPAIARTLERMGYGESLTTGKGMTTKPKADTMEAAMAVAPMARATKGAPVGAMFIGAKSKRWDQAMADLAQQMEKAGADPVEIWNKTGTFRGKDGHLRQEISDQGTKFLAKSDREDRVEAINDTIAEMKRKIAPTPQKDLFPKLLNEAKKGVRDDISIMKGSVKNYQRNPNTQGIYAPFIIEHPELYKAYPELNQVLVNTPGGNGSTRGGLSVIPSHGVQPGKMEMDVYNRGLMTDPESTSLHEMQHAIQTIEGWSPGGSPTMAFADPRAHEMLKNRLDELHRPATFDEFQKANRFPEDEAQAAYDEYVRTHKSFIHPKVERELQRDVAHEFYRRLAGEAEARATQERMNMGMRERRQHPPAGSYDYPQEDLFTRPPMEYKEGGEVKMGAGGLLKAAKAAQQAEKAKEAMQVIKASEAFGQHEGLPVYITQADRTKVGQGFLGGPGFSSLQLTSEPHREAMAAWGVKNPGTAKTIIGDPSMGENPLFTTMIGSPTQHQSNQMVFDKLYRAFKSEAKKGNLSDELRYMINDKLAKAVDKEGKNIFPSNVDILDKNFHKMADTFDRRSIAGHLMGGVGIGGKKGQIIDYDKLIKQTTDPLLIDAPSGAIGPRAFTLDKNVIERPDLHPAFPTILTGQDLGVAFEPVPRELFMQDFINKVRAEKGRDPGYMDYVRGRPPSQFISEDWLTSLQKKGHKKGGLLKVKRKK